MFPYSLRVSRETGAGEGSCPRPLALHGLVTICQLKSEYARSAPQ
jgi:hypothetical protein